MKSLLTTLSVLTLSITVGTLNSTYKKTIQNVDIKTNYISNKTQQDTIYIDKNGKQVTTSEKDLASIVSKEVIQIGFYKTVFGQIKAVRMPKTIEKIPDQLPSEITSLNSMFNSSKKFNQDISKWNTTHIINMSCLFQNSTLFNKDISNWNTSNVTDMHNMFYGALSFNQDLSTWNVDKVTEYSNFATGSGINNPKKLPKFKWGNI